MAIHSVSLAPDRVLEWSTSDDVPTLDTYCADVDCCPSHLCDACILATQLCDLCDAPATVVDRTLPRAPLPLCAACKAQSDAEDAAAEKGDV